MGIFFKIRFNQMTDRMVKSALLALFAVQANAAERGMPGRTIEDCTAFADLFDNTCDTTAGVLDDFAGHTGAEMSCIGTMRCPGGDGEETFDSSNPCTWTRKLCVTCEEDDSGVVYITVQTNNLPNHCIHSVINNPTAYEDEWKVIWNADVTGVENYTEDDFATSEQTDEVLCDINRTVSSNLHASVDYQ